MFERYIEITNSWFQHCSYCDLKDITHDGYDWSSRPERMLIDGILLPTWGMISSCLQILKVYLMK